MPVESIVEWRKLFTSARGRIGRARFWAGVAAVFALWAALGVAIKMLDRPGAEPLSVVLLAILLLVLPLVPLCAVYAKRWHDRDKSGWWSLLLLAPVIGQLWIFVELGMVAGTRGANQYGPDPLG